MNLCVFYTGKKAVSMEHPDVTSALRTGYATFQSSENKDCPENRDDYIDEHMVELVRWLRIGYPDILDEFIEMHRFDYRMWLN